MTDNAFKKAARQRQKATGESYSRARRHVDNRTNDDDPSTAALLSALGITNTGHIDPAALWVPRQFPAGGDLLLRAPIGLRDDDGTPLWLDLKDEAHGGNGPHQLMIGMTGSGKTTLLRALMFGLLVRYSPDVVQVILGDLKAAGGWEEFADYPHTAAVFEDCTAMVDLVLNAINQRSQALHWSGVVLRGKGFDTLAEYNAACQTPEGKNLTPLPTIFVVIDEWAPEIEDHPDGQDAIEALLRKGRSLGVYAVLAGQRADEQPDVVGHVSQRIALKVAGPSISRRIIGTEDAYHISDGKDVKGTGFFVRAPGAEPIKFRGFRVPDSLVRTVGRQLAAAADGYETHSSIS